MVCERCNHKKSDHYPNNSGGLECEFQGEDKVYCNCLGFVMDNDERLAERVKAEEEANLYWNESNQEWDKLD